jgi:hypothetical protein
MNQNLMVHFETEKEGIKFTLSVPYGTKLGLCYDACHEILEDIVRMSKEAVDKAKSSDIAAAPDVVTN